MSLFPTVPTIELDVRPQLRSKQHPLELILNTVKALKKEEILILHATLKPTPLLGIMKLKGYANRVVKAGEEHWITTFVHKSQKKLLEQLSEQEVSTPRDAESTSESTAESTTKAEPAVVPGIASEPQVYSLDNRGLEPPQPMVRTLSKLEQMQAGDTLIITNDRVPVFLIEELKLLGYTFSIEELLEEQARITITKGP